jgi:hypothetical protein
MGFQSNSILEWLDWLAKRFTFSEESITKKRVDGSNAHKRLLVYAMAVDTVGR